MTAARVMIVIAAVGFFVLFSPWTQGAIAFWPIMSLTTGLLATGSIVLQSGPQRRQLYRPRLSDPAIGVLSALLLYAVFYVGHFFSTLILPFAADQVSAIYTIRQEARLWQIALLLVLVIGPAEEIFWRGFIQRRLCDRYGLMCGFLLTAAIYAGVHLWSFNLMLIAAAAVGGVFWGVLFLATERMWPCIISHALWDVMIFVLWPIHG